MNEELEQLMEYNQELNIEIDISNRIREEKEKEIENLLKENQQLKEQLEASEKARIDAIHYIRTELLCFDNESIEYIEGLKILNELDIDKGE